MLKWLALLLLSFNACALELTTPGVKRLVMPIPYAFDTGFTNAMRKAAANELAAWSEASNGAVTFKRVNQSRLKYGIVFMTESYGGFANELTLATTKSDKKLAGSLIVLNAGVYRWTAGSMLNKVLRHEIGHALGFAHSDDKDSIMYAAYVDGDRRFSDDDYQGIRAIYNISHVK